MQRSPNKQCTSSRGLYQSGYVRVTWGNFFQWHELDCPPPQSFWCPGVWGGCGWSISICNLANTSFQLILILSHQAGNHFPKGKLKGLSLWPHLWCTMCLFGKCHLRNGDGGEKSCIDVLPGGSPEGTSAWPAPCQEEFSLLCSNKSTLESLAHVMTYLSTAPA